MTAPHSYPAYRPSGVPWLGDAPAHWDVVQLGRIGVFSKGSGGTKDDEVPDGIPCVRYGDLYTTHKYSIDQTRSYVSLAKKSTYTPINRGDVLFPTSGETIEEIGKSAVNLMDTQVVCGGDLIIFRPTIPMEPKFAGYALDCPVSQTQKSLMGRGITIMHIYSSQLKYLWLPLPPLDEQVAIVRYMDAADQRIRDYVSAKERLIALLGEERQAIIHQAVTRGLDPNVRLKPSGVEWLGDGPEHWDTKRLKHVCSRPAQYGANIAASEYTTSGVRFLRTTDISAKGDIVGEGVYIPPFRSPEHLLNDGDILLTRSGATVGQSFIYEANEHGKCCFAGYLVRFAPSDQMLPRFIYLFTLTPGFQNSVQQSAIISTIENVNAEKYANIYLSVPPLDEQVVIVQHLDELCEKIDVAIDKARRQIDLINEYRTRLIADLVTGKIDVREIANTTTTNEVSQPPRQETRA